MYGAVVMGRLIGIPDPDLDVVEPVDREVLHVRIYSRSGCRFSRRHRSVSFTPLFLRRWRHICAVIYARTESFSRRDDRAGAISEAYSRTVA